jgi:hypothetical protein
MVCADVGYVWWLINSRPVASAAWRCCFESWLGCTYAPSQRHRR